MAEESPFELYLDIPYAIIGAFAGMSYGLTRMTADLDIVVEMNEEQVEALAAAYPLPRFYPDPHQMRESIRLGKMFNIIDTTAGRKVDLIPATMEPGYGFALKRRIRRTIHWRGRVFEAWFARPEDVIVGKLMAWKEGHSFKHEQDIRDILVAVRLNEEPEWTSNFDFEYIDRWAAWLGQDVVRFWQRLKAIAGV
jgi:hypothetical protein